MKIYVDGSYTFSGGIGWAFVVIGCDGRKLHEDYGAVLEDEWQQYRNISGELRATVNALQWAMANGQMNVSVYYDCNGIKEWAKGTWSARAAVTKEYKQAVRLLIAGGMVIDWVKVKSHSGDCWNSYADKLCRSVTKPRASSKPTASTKTDITRWNIPSQKTEANDEVKRLYRIIARSGV